ncbi:5-(carboxyamino)imidazole ribonucleotide mutase [Suttonella sp. R2A3]|uniref:5-(carboxyamino)imidazole ribonucleotide mutase n=1 Tax=Suttonella sp. R2A3 TaxID=2908648 RepID=UPI001F239A05|nr:5-(carboxyamino)imidazole ribonucleotide mutase [Suttonella sp. R2A3]UJF24748.1 5-(carboxyamino)imidazole ribonucleotide mutase [Suttonella sp. R2A3]
MAKIGIVMGSDSDLRVMDEAVTVCRQFGVDYEVTIVSAHRTPERLLDYGRSAAERGLSVIIAGAGGAAHLPGMLASLTPLPVIGVPIHSSNSIDGWDSVLSILQMPGGVPVATVALDGAKNAGLLALRILGVSNDELQKRMCAYQDEMKQAVLEKASALQNDYPCAY